MAKFNLQNNCSGSSSGPWDFTAARTGSVLSVGTPSPGFVTLPGGGKQIISVSYTTGSTAGTGTVKLTATWDGPPITTTSATQTITVTGSGPQPAPLRVGLFSTLDLIGKGPGGDSVGGIYGAALGNPTPTEISDRLKEAYANNVTLILNLAGSRAFWTNAGTNANGSSCRQYDATKYRTQINRFTFPQISHAAADSLTAAIASRRAVIYLVDEPFLAEFCTDVPKLDPTAVNAMGGTVKSIWPGAITLVRASAVFMTGGWAGSPAPSTGFWTKVDYAWSQFVGQHIPSAGETPRQFFDRERSQLNTWHLGMVPGHSFLNGGIYNDLAVVPVVPACWDYDMNGSSGYVTGTSPANLPQGAKITCGNRPAEETRFLSSPALLKAVIDGIWDDTYAPFFMLWAHANSSQLETVPFIDYEARQDFKDALDYMITKAAGRTTWRGWNPAK
jgi:hypothetical protein